MSSPGRTKRKHGIFEVFQQPSLRMSRSPCALVHLGVARPDSIDPLFHGRAGEPH
jgi:hypothetical protein